MPENYHKNPPYPLLSVVIPALNEEKFIGKTLFSLLNQDFKDFEIIIIDNNSTDRTPKIAKKFGARVIFEPRQGVGYARQRGFLEAKGKIIASTDADAVLPPDWLSNIILHFEKDEKLIALGGLSYLSSGSLMARLASFYFLYPFLILDKIISGGWSLMGSNFAMRRKAFLDVGGFNTDLIINEDIEISHRLREIGKVVLDPNFRVKVSGRRYRNGLILGLMDYLPTTIMRFFFKKYNKFMKLSPVRVEEPYVNKNLMLVIIPSLFFLFYFLAPAQIYAKGTRFLRKEINSFNLKVTSSRNTIKNNERILRDLIRREREEKDSDLF